MKKEKRLKRAPILGIDPGLAGAFIITDGEFVRVHEMPVQKHGTDRSIHFDGVHELLFKVQEEFGAIHIFIERAVPMAMGSKSAFNYGRGFAALEIAIELLKFPATYIEPQKWSKEMHEGISKDLKPKAKSLVAVKRLYPSLLRYLPKTKKGDLYDGPIDALLIAGYGLRKAGLRPVEVPKQDDFY